MHYINWPQKTQHFRLKFWMNAQFLSSQQDLCMEFIKLPIICFGYENGLQKRLNVFDDTIKLAKFSIFCNLQKFRIKTMQMFWFNHRVHMCTL